MSKSKNKKSKKSAKSKQKQTPKPKALKAVSPQHHEKALERICSLTDPFCRHAIGARWTDSSTLNSMPFTVRGSLEIATDANGYGAAVFVPSLSYGYGDSPTITLGVATYSALTAWPNISAITSSISQFRLTSGGITINSIMTPLTASGYTFVQELAPGGNADLTTLSINSTSNSAWYRHPNKNTDPINYIFKPGGTDSRRFRSINSSSAITSVDSNDYTMVHVTVTGPVSTTCLVVDYVLHFEIVFKAGDAMNLMVKPSAGSNLALTQAATDAIVQAPSFLVGTQQNASSQLTSIANKALTGAKPAIKGAIASGVTAYAGPLVGGIVSAAMSDM